MGKLWLILFLIIFIRQYSVNAHKYSAHNRYRRQILDEPGQQIDLNVTVPYIFAARLYSYGPNRGDISIRGRQEIYKLENPIHFMGEVYDSLYISRDGSVGFTEKRQKPSALPVEEPTIAVFWQPATLGMVWYRETDDVNIVNLAHNEVNIQYRYGSQFRVRSVVLITWENIKDPKIPEASGNTFQLALIIGDSMTFAHFIYSKLNNNANAVAGFSSRLNSYSLPDSSTNDAILLSEKSDIGIPGEWLFRIDGDQIYLCGAGFKGLECIESCAPSQWFNDCSRSCHCDGGDSCDQENGRCPNGKCSPGWNGEPICNQDLDECELNIHNCPNEQPDCLNTPGSFLCLCFEYDEDKKICKGSNPSPASAPIPVDIVPMHPSFTRHPPTNNKLQVQRNRFKATTNLASMSSTFETTSPPPPPSSSPSPIPIFAQTNFDPRTPLFTTEKTTKQATTGIQTTTEQTACSRCDNNALCNNGICQCKNGYTGDGFRCYDIDECEINQKICGNHSICTNTIGHFDCSCYGGYRFENSKCVDVDECRENPNICGGPNKGTNCLNKDGSFECKCRDGFEGDPSVQCYDINECNKPDACGPNAKCTNIDGGFECECHSGYERITEEAQCTDRDECAVEPCHPAAICSNTRGSYKCECIEGFIGDGKTCYETILYPISNDSLVIQRSSESVTRIPLIMSVTIFGKKYSEAFLSTNGLLSFDEPLTGLIDHVENIKKPVIFALHAQFDYIRDGLIAYTFINETDILTFPLLMRSTIGIQTILGLENFNTKRLHIFTFDRVRQAGSENLNSFQIVIAESSDATILSLIYEKVEAKGPMTGISTPSKFFLLPNDRLSSSSNVGQPGKWMYRLDTIELQTCPPGRIGEPICNQECQTGHYGINCESTCHCDGSVACNLITGSCPGSLCRAGWEGSSCDQDIDECSRNLVTCANGSQCVNTKGGYRCDCKKGFIPIGKECKPIDRCLSHFGVPCSRNAECIDKDEIDPKCVCLKGYNGDGFRCTTHEVFQSNLSNNNLISDLTHHLMEATKNLNISENGINKEEDHPFLMKNWVTPEAPRSPIPPVRPKFVTVQTPPLTYTAPPAKPTMKDKDLEIMEGNKEKHGDGDDMHLVFVILPTALIIIWILLIFVVLVLCKMSKRKREARERQQYSRTWKSTPGGLPITSRSMMTTSAISNPNVLYGRTPRITTYDGY